MHRSSTTNIEVITRMCVCDTEIYTLLMCIQCLLLLGTLSLRHFTTPILWYDRPQTGMKRSVHQAALDAYSMMDSCAAASYYHQLQAPAVKYMKPEPVTYYHYAEDAERYQNNIAVSGQNTGHASFSSASLTNYTPSHYASYTTATAAAAAAAAYNTMSTESSNGFNGLGHHVVTPSQVAHAPSDPPGCQSSTALQS